MNDIKFRPGRWTTTGLVLACFGCTTLIAGCGDTDAEIDDGPPAPEIKPGSIPGAAGPDSAALPPVAPGVPPPVLPPAVANVQMKRTMPPPINPRVRVTPPPPAVKGAPPPAVPRAILNDPNR